VANTTIWQDISLDETADFGSFSAFASFSETGMYRAYDLPDRALI
jgi:hypothetical protein